MRHLIGFVDELSQDFIGVQHRAPGIPHRVLTGGDLGDDGIQCALLVQAGLDMAAIDVRSHGEAELLVPTADGVFEPRNRRVEVTVR